MFCFFFVLIHKYCYTRIENLFPPGEQIQSTIGNYQLCNTLLFSNIILIFLLNIRYIPAVVLNENNVNLIHTLTAIQSVYVVNNWYKINLISKTKTK